MGTEHGNNRHKSSTFARIHCAHMRRGVDSRIPIPIAEGWQGSGGNSCLCILNAEEEQCFERTAAGITV